VANEAKAALFDALAEVAKALANGRRAELIDTLAQGERSVEELATVIGQSVANTSQHLQRLLRAGLVTTRRDGTRIYYSLSSPRVYTLWRTMTETAERHVADLDSLATAFLGDRSTMQTIGRDELRARMRAGDIVVIDVRPDAEFQAGHIRGALSVPTSRLKARLADIPSDTDVVAYCRGPYCVMADDAVRYLSRNGRRALRLEGGFPEWAEEGRPVSAGA
jgi:rhodanese-related sulfurtransferase/predicted transcriptional regulator